MIKPMALDFMFVFVSYVLSLACGWLTSTDRLTHAPSHWSVGNRMRQIHVTVPYKNDRFLQVGVRSQSLYSEYITYVALHFSIVVQGK